MGCFGRRSIIFMILMILSYRQVLVNGQILTHGFYTVACPLAETIVRETVTAYFRIQPNIAPGLLKLLYSDCFVEGCDGSVLISGPNTERTAEANLNLRGFEVIDDIKEKIESVCPGIVSCADILAAAARDAVVLTKGPSWDVKSGRRDGLVSLAANVKNLPSPDDSIAVLLKKFADVGFNTTDFITLIGGHTIGTAACKFVLDRIYSLNGSTIESTFNPLFLLKLQNSCPLDGSGSNRVALDTGSEFVFDTSIYKNILTGSAVLKFEKELMTVNNEIQNQIMATLTVEQMMKALSLMVTITKTSRVNGEIRRNCSAVNPT